MSNKTNKQTKQMKVWRFCAIDIEHSQSSILLFLSFYSFSPPRYLHHLRSCTNARTHSLTNAKVAIGAKNLCVYFCKRLFFGAEQKFTLSHTHTHTAAQCHIACENMTNMTAKRHSIQLIYYKFVHYVTLSVQFSFNMLLSFSILLLCVNGVGCLYDCLSIVLLHCYLSFNHVNRSYNYLDDKQNIFTQYYILQISVLTRECKCVYVYSIHLYMSCTWFS